MRGRWALGVVSALVPLAVLAPLLGRGFVLSYDMVFVPRQDVASDDLGLGSALPRAVPSDALVSLATSVLPGDVVQQVILLAVLAFACLGAGRAVPSDSPVARCVAAIAYGWNPYVAERLVQGQWALLAGYAALPWALRAAADLRRGARGAAARLAVATAVGAVSPTGGLLTAGLAAAVLAWPGAGRSGRNLAGYLAVSLVLNAPWLVPGLLRPGGAGSDPAGVDAFAARAENWSGTVGSLLGLGGIWNADVVPPSRHTVVAPVLTALLLLLAGAGWPRLRRGWDRPVASALAVTAAGGLVLALVGTGRVGRAVLRPLMEQVSGAGLLRDGQKFLAPLALLVAVGAGLGAEVLLDRLRHRPAVAGLTAAAVLMLPVVTTPDLAWGAGGRLQAVRYPPDWAAVRDLLGRSREPGDVVSLPFGAFRAFAWNGGRTLLDPAPRALPRTVVVDDTLVVDGTVVAGEDRRAAAVRAALAAGEPLGRLGVGWILVERGTPGQVPPDALVGAQRRYAGPDLELYRLSRPRPGPDGRCPPRRRS